MNMRCHVAAKLVFWPMTCDQSLWLATTWLSFPSLSTHHT
jgi:hypothetical protein